MARASLSNTAPASVGRTPVLLRSSSLTPSWRSRELTVCDKAGWLMWSRREAADIPPSSATATKAVSSRNSITSAYGGDPSIFPVYAFSALLGVFEVAAAVLIAIKPSAPRLSIIGSLLAILLFLATISFLFTTPGVGEPAGGGFPAISLTGEFLLKDIPLLGLSFWTLADSMRAVAQRAAVN